MFPREVSAIQRSRSLQGCGHGQENARGSTGVQLFHKPVAAIGFSGSGIDKLLLDSSDFKPSCRCTFLLNCLCSSDERPKIIFSFNDEIGRISLNFSS